MRNSFIPVLAVLLIAVAAFALATRGASRGSGGPEIMPGIFREIKRESKRVPSAALQVSSSVEGAQCSFARAHVVLIAGDDTLPLTRAMMLATAEEVTHRGGIAILDPIRTKDREPLPLGSDLRLAISTVSGTPAEHPEGSLAITWRITAEVPAPALALPAGAWLPDDAVAESSTCLLHTTITGTAGNWPSWYAAIGRASATKLLDGFALGQRLGDDLAAHVAASTWPMIKDIEATARLPQPPGADELRWNGAFQHPLVRGWVGMVAGETTTDRTGNIIPALQPVLTRMARGGWSAQRAADGAVVTLVAGQLCVGTDSIDPSAVAWIRDHDGVATDLRIAHAGHGWQVTMWQVRPGAPSVVEEWRTLAASGNALAAAQLARHGNVLKRLSP